MNSTFYCSCGYVFHASEVAEALTTFTLLRERMVEYIRNMNQADRAILKKSESSFTSWVSQMAYKVGRQLGITITLSVQQVKQILRKFL